MKLKPFRDYSEHDVRNLFAFSGNNAAASTIGGVIAAPGDAVSLLVGVNSQALPFDIVSNLGSAISNRVYSPLYETTAKVTWTASGAKPYGVLLYGVQNLDAYGIPLRFDPIRKAELQVVCSGETVPILRRGLVCVSGYSGVAGAGSGITVSNAGNGQWVVALASAATSFGTFIGGADTEGFALAEINCF